MDLNVYNIHFVVGLLGRPEEVSYRAHFERGVDTSGIITMKYPDFNACLIAAKDCASPYISSLQGDKGCIYFDGPPNFLSSFNLQELRSEPVYFERENKHRMSYEFEKFSEIIDNNDLAYAREKMKETLDVMWVIDEAKKSAGIVFEDDAVL